jgi:hypothetical protein
MQFDRVALYHPGYVGVDGCVFVTFRESSGLVHRQGYFFRVEGMIQASDDFINPNF